MDLDTLYQVNRLVYLSLAHSHGRKSLVIRHQQELGNLIQRYQADAGFQQAVATALFPQELDLELPVEDLGAVTLADIFEILRRFAKLCPEPDENKDHIDAQDTASDRLHPQIITLAQRIREMPEENPDIRQAGGAGGNSWRELIEQVMRHMTETRYTLAFEEHDGAVEYRPTPAYQAAVREGMLYTFQAFRDIVNQGKEEAESREDDEHV